MPVVFMRSMTSLSQASICDALRCVLQRLNQFSVTLLHFNRIQCILRLAYVSLFVVVYYHCYCDLPMIHCKKKPHS